MIPPLSFSLFQVRDVFAKLERRDTITSGRREIYKRNYREKPIGKFILFPRGDKNHLAIIDQTNERKVGGGRQVAVVRGLFLIFFVRSAGEWSIAIVRLWSSGEGVAARRGRKMKVESGTYEPVIN